MAMASAAALSAKQFSIPRSPACALYLAFLSDCASFTASATPLSFAICLTLARSAPASDFEEPRYCPCSLRAFLTAAVILGAFFATAGFAPVDWVALAALRSSRYFLILALGTFLCALHTIPKT